MDNLARDMMLAKQAGLSYGQWKVMNPTTKQKEEDVIPEGWRTCEFCGKTFRKTQGKRFCDIGCRNEAYYQQTREKKCEYGKRYRDQIKAEKLKRA